LACLCLPHVFLGLACLPVISFGLPVISFGLPGLPVVACVNFYMPLKGYRLNKNRRLVIRRQRTHVNLNDLI
jgi:hypothetical protein